MDVPTPVEQVGGRDAVDLEAACPAPLQRGNRVRDTAEEQIDGLAAELSGMEAEQQRPAAALGVADPSTPSRRRRSTIRPTPSGSCPSR
jgi:hypothetical protein